MGLDEIFNSKDLGTPQSINLGSSDCGEMEHQECRTAASFLFYSIENTT